MWASADHLCHCQTTQSCFFFHLATFTAQLLSKGGLDIKIHHVFLLFWEEQEREAVMLPICSCHAVCPSHIHPAWRWRARHPAGTCCALGSHGNNSWDLKSPGIAEKAQVRPICCSNCSRERVSMNSQQINTLPKFGLMGKSSAGTSWRLWVSLQLEESSLGTHSGTWPFQLRFSTFNPERSTCRAPAGVERLLGNKSSSTK